MFTLDFDFLSVLSSIECVRLAWADLPDLPDVSSVFLPRPDHPLRPLEHPRHHDLLALRGLPPGPGLFLSLVPSEDAAGVAAVVGPEAAEGAAGGGRRSDAVAIVQSKEEAALRPGRNNANQGQNSQFYFLFLTESTK